MTQGMAGNPLLQGKGAGGAGRMAQQPGPAAGETGAALAAGREKSPMAGTGEARQAVFAANEMGGVSPKTSAANFGREAAHAQRVTGQPGFAKGEMGGASRTRAETSLPLSWRTRKWDAFIRKRNLNFQRLRKAKTAAALRPARFH